jgi:hypothetical protein
MVTKVPSPYERDVFRGRLLDNATIAALIKMEHVLGYQLTITQGIGGAAASAGTHLKGRAVDLAYWDVERKNRVARDICFAGWPRDEVPGLWPAHWHGINIFENRANQKGITQSAWQQIGAYDRGEDGLVGDKKDAYPYRPEPRAVLTMDEYKFIMKGGLEAPPVTPVTRVRDSLVETLHSLSESIALAKNTRAVSMDDIVDLKAARRVIKRELEELPPR